MRTLPIFNFLSYYNILTWEFLHLTEKEDRLFQVPKKRPIAASGRPFSHLLRRRNKRFQFAAKEIVPEKHKIKFVKNRGIPDFKRPQSAL